MTEFVCVPNNILYNLLVGLWFIVVASILHVLFLYIFAFYEIISRFSIRRQPQLVEVYPIMSSRPKYYIIFHYAFWTLFRN
jgi:hypothetical protein